MAASRRVTVTIPGMDAADAERLAKALKVRVEHAEPSPLLHTATLTLDIEAAKAGTAGRRAHRAVADALERLALDHHPIYAVRPPSA